MPHGYWYLHYYHFYWRLFEDISNDVEGWIDTSNYNKNVKRPLSMGKKKRLQTYDRITTYPYGTNAYKICENEMMAKKKYI